jgi:hypothetical protein
MTPRSDGLQGSYVDIHALVADARRVSGLVVDANDKYGFPARIRDHGSIDANVGRDMTGQGIGRGGRLRAVFATLLALSLLGSLVLAGNASAGSTSSATLSERVATQQATRLMQRQLRNRDRRLVEARISVGERASRTRWLFLYDDLNRQGVVCTAIIEVRQRGRTITSRFLRNSNCETPGDEGLAFRAAARFVDVAVTRKRRSVLRSVTRYTESAEACETLDIPDSRQDEALLLLTTGLTQATIRPIQSDLDDYATSLQSLNVVDPALASGAAAWRDFVDTVRALPQLQPSYCAVLAEWGNNGYTDETAPVDFAALRAIAARIQADGAEVRRTGRYMSRLGIDPLTVVGFSLDNLIGDVTPSDNASVAKLALK